MKASREEAMKALHDLDWSSATVETQPRKTTIVYSTRLPDELARWLEDEATRRGINPSAMIRELVESARREAIGDPVVTVRRSDLRRAIDSVVQQAA